VKLDGANAQVPLLVGLRQCQGSAVDPLRMLELSCHIKMDSTLQTESLAARKLPEIFNASLDVAVNFVEACPFSSHIFVALRPL
jgi:hypothetical protein